MSLLVRRWSDAAITSCSVSMWKIEVATKFCLEIALSQMVWFAKFLKYGRQSMNNFVNKHPNSRGHV